MCFGMGPITSLLVCVTLLLGLFIFGLLSAHHAYTASLWPDRLATWQEHYQQFEQVFDLSEVPSPTAPQVERLEDEPEWL